MKKRYIMICIAVMFAVGCGKKEEISNEVEYTYNKIVPDSDTKVSSQQNHTAQSIMGNVNRGEDNTQEMEEKNNESNTEKLQSENTAAVNKSISAKLSSMGVDRGFSIIGSSYTSTTEYVVQSVVDDSTLTLETTVNENNSIIETYTAGSINGSEYGGLIDVSKINDMEIADVEEALFNAGVYDVCTVMEKSDKGYIISDSMNRYLVHDNNGSIAVEIITK